MSKSKRATLKRKFISLETKVQILDRTLKGERVSDIGKSLNLNEATVRTIKKNEKEIRSTVAAGSSISAKYVARSRATIIEKMEKSLGIWIEDCCKNRIPLNGNVIRRKALNIYMRLKESGESPVNPDFVGSKGWFEKFKKRFPIHTVRIQGETPTANCEAGKTYPEKIESIIKEEVFIGDETGLWWKDVSDRSFVSEKESLLGSSDNGISNIPGIIELAKSRGSTEDECFSDTAIEDVQDLLVKEEAGEANLEKMPSEIVSRIDTEENATENSEITSFSFKKLQEGLTLARNLETFLLTEDPCAERSRKFQRQLQNCLSPYIEVYWELLRDSKQTKTDYLKREKNGKNPNEEMEGDDVVRPKKRTRLVAPSSDQEEMKLKRA